METRTLVPTTLEPAAELDRLGDEIAEPAADGGLEKSEPAAVFTLALGSA
jgi:hypothetical protein